MMRVWSLSAIVVFAFVAGCQEGTFTGSLGGSDILSQHHDRAVEVVRSGLADPDGVVRVNAIEVVNEAGIDELMPSVSKMLSDKAVAVRFTAAVTVGDMKYRPGGTEVKKLLKDPNLSVRIAAAYAMTKLGKSGYADLIRSAIASKDQTARANAALILGKLGKKQDLRLLYKCMRDPESSTKASIQAIESIAMLGDKEIYKNKLWGFLISKYADDRVMGIRGMGALGTADAKNAILTMLQDEVREVRLCAAEQLGRLGERAGEQEVLDYFKTEFSESSGRSVANVLATLASGRIGGRNLSAFLPGLLQSRDKRLQLAAGQSILLLTR